MHTGVQRVIGDLPIGQTTAPLVVSHEGRECAEVLEQVPPDRALPVELEMTEPAGDVDERRSLTVDRIGKPDAVSRSQEADVLRGRCGCEGWCGGGHDSAIDGVADATPVVGTRSLAVCSK